VEINANTKGNKHIRSQWKEKALFIRYASHFLGSTALRPVIIAQPPSKEPVGPYLAWASRISGLAAVLHTQMPPWLYASEQRQHWHKAPARDGKAPKARHFGSAYAQSIKNLKLIPLNMFLSHAALDNATPLSLQIALRDPTV
jgi:hypothetical protein